MQLKRLQYQIKTTQQVVETVEPQKQDQNKNQNQVSRQVRVTRNNKIRIIIKSSK